MLDRDLEEAEEQYSLAVRSHMLVVDNLLDLQVGVGGGGTQAPGRCRRQALMGARGRNGGWDGVLVAGPGTHACREGAALVWRLYGIESTCSGRRSGTQI